MKKEMIEHLQQTLELSAEEAQEFLGDFFISLDECCQTLRELQAGSDFSGIRRVTHTLLGFCENMGAIDLADASRVLNSSAKAADVAACQQGIVEILVLADAYHRS